MSHGVYLPERVSQVDKWSIPAHSNQKAYFTGSVIRLTSSWDHQGSAFLKEPLQIVDSWEATFQVRSYSGSCCNYWGIGMSMILQSAGPNDYAPGVKPKYGYAGFPGTSFAVALDHYDDQVGVYQDGVINQALFTETCTFVCRKESRVVCVCART